MKRATQLELPLKKTHGGRRKGAGRPNRSGLRAHVRRPKLDLRHPIHVTLKLTQGFRVCEARMHFGASDTRSSPRELGASRSRISRFFRTTFISSWNRERPHSEGLFRVCAFHSLNVSISAQIGTAWSSRSLSPSHTQNTPRSQTCTELRVDERGQTSGAKGRRPREVGDPDGSIFISLFISGLEDPLRCRSGAFVFLLV